MALVMRSEPFSQDVGRLFNAFFDSAEGGVRGVQQRFVPAMDLTEEGENYVLRADLPGLSEEDVNIEIEDGVLTVSGERTVEQNHSEGGVSRYERSYGRFSRQLSVPEGVDVEAIAASFDRGVLEVRIPKPEERKRRRVSIAVDDAQPRQVESTASERS